MNDMYTQITNGLVIVLLIAFFTTTVNADTSNKEKKLSAAHLSQIEAAYEKYLKNKKNTNKRKFATKKVSYSPKDNYFKKAYTNRLHVTATAYTSHVGQTDSTPNIAAWGDRLRPGMKAIAVSRDLLKVYGLKHGQKVRIKGLSGEYAVLDKMNRRWRKKIDIYMGLNKRKAFKWGRRKVEILWDS